MDKKRVFIISGIVVFVLAAIFLLWNFVFKNRIGLDNDFLNRYKNEFTLSDNNTKSEPFSLVSNKISQGGYIAINVPAGFTKDVVRNTLKFNPDINGDFIESSDNNKVLFKPSADLKIGSVYAATISSDNGNISGDFTIDKKPEIVSILPNENTEIDPKTNITIVFNRPIVPLSVVDVMDDVEIPVSITPKTNGRFKWISTNTLQFIPDGGQLIASSDYKVTINSGFNSTDGVKIKGITRNFKTKVLRYNFVLASSIRTVYNNPITVIFNEPFDLNKTQKEISLKDSNNKSIDFIAEYGVESDGKTQNKNILVVYNKQDKYGRSKIWNFESEYYFKLNKAYSIGGNIDLNESYSTTIKTTGVYSSMFVLSDKSSVLNEKVFDPTGKLAITFYENIDIDKTIFNSDKVTGKAYAKKCKDENLIMPDCDQEDDKKTVYLTFDSSKIALGEQFDISIDSVISSQGLKINNEKIVLTLKSFDKLKILSTYPKNDSTKADLNTFVICSNNPLTPYVVSDVKNNFKSNIEFESSNLQSSYYIDANSDRTYVKCNNGEYETRMSYPGFSPNSNYEISFDVVDIFDQKANSSVKFSTIELSNKTLSFYQYQQRYNITTKDKTILNFAGYNMDYVDLTVCKVTAENMLSYLTYGPNYYDSNAKLNCLNSVTKKIELPAKYWAKNYFKVNLKDYFNEDYGHYVLSFSNPGYVDGLGRMVYERNYVTVTNLNVVAKSINPDNSNTDKDLGLVTDKYKDLKNLYFVMKMSDLSNVSGANVNIYSSENYKKGSNILATQDDLARGNYETKVKKSLSGTTGQDGLVNLDPVYKTAGAIVSIGDDSAIVVNSETTLEYASDAYNSQVVYLYSDRPIYKPGDTVNFKGIYRIGYDGDYQVFKDKKITVKVYDPNNNEVYNKELSVNDFGSFTDSVILSGGASLGTYRIESKNYSTYFFDVQEYVPAAFKIDLKSDREEYVANDNFSINLDADYYFGTPVESGKVDYSITSTDYYFDKYNGSGYYNFINYANNGYYRDYFAYRGSTNLVNGKATISGKLDFSKFFNEDNRGSKIFNVYATVTNSTGNSITSVKSFIVHAGNYYIGINSDKYFLAQGEKFNINLKTLDTSGKQVSLNNVDLKINKVTWVYNKRKEVDGSYYYNWERKYELVKNITLNSNYNGNVDYQFGIEKEGEYIAIASYKDEKGNIVSSSTDLYVFGTGDVFVRPTNDTSLDIIAEQTKDLSVGEKGKVIIKSPYKSAKAIISIERGKVYSYEIININQNLFEYSFDLKKEYAPNIYLSVVLLSNKPELKYGNVSFQVDSKDKELNIEVKTNKETYLPGENVSADIYVKDANNVPVSGELSIAVVDESVLALKGNPKKDPVSMFYNYFPLTVSTSSNLKNILYNIDVANGTKGGSGATNDDLSKKKRGEFRDTAFWSANVNTDANGYAHINFKLPDNLTTWQIEVVGVTKDTKLGTDYKEFKSNKDLMLTALKPNFVVLGDEFLVGAKLFNQTGNDQIVDVAFDYGKLELKDDKNNLKIEIKKGETKNIYFRVAAPITLDSNNTNFSVSVKNAKYSDSITDTINIKTNDVFETVATSSYSKNNIREYVYLPENISSNKGELTINSSASLFPYVKSAVKYISDYYDSSTEGIATKLSSLISIDRLNKLNITEKIETVKYNNVDYKINDLYGILLSDLYKNYKNNLGFSYYATSSGSDYYLSLYVLDVFNKLKDNNIVVSNDVYKNLQSVVLNKINNSNDLNTDKNVVIITADVLNNSIKYNKVNIDNLISIVGGYLANDKYLSIDSANMSLIYLLDLVNNSNKFDSSNINKIYKILQNRISIDSRGAFLQSNNVVGGLFESSVYDTASFVDWSINYDKDYSFDNLLRWLNYSKNIEGYWNNQHDTLSVINAFVSYIDIKKENKVDFTSELLINNQKKSSYSFSVSNVTSKNSYSLPIGELKKNALNSISIEKTDKNSGLYYDVALRYYVPSNGINKKDEGFAINRGFYRLNDADYQTKVNTASVGEVLKGRIEVVVSKDRNYVNIDSYIPAGFELINFALSIENQNSYTDYNNSNDSMKPMYHSIKEGLADIDPDHKEMREDRLFLFKQYLQPGVYKFDYYVRALIPGKYSFLPSYVYEKYTPENFGRTSGEEFVINQ